MLSHCGLSAEPRGTTIVDITAQQALADPSPTPPSNCSSKGPRELPRREPRGGWGGNPATRLRKREKPNITRRGRARAALCFLGQWCPGKAGVLDGAPERIPKQRDV